MKSIFLISCLISNLNAFKHTTELYIVGDSLSDTGNSFELTNGKIPNPKFYANKRYCNGPIWIDYLAEKYPKLTIKNYAYGGATTDNEVIKLRENVPSLKDQAIKISNELSQLAANKTTTKQEANKIAIVWSGGNDLFANITIANQSTVPSLKKIVGILQETKEFNNILVFNLINHIRTPYAKELPEAQKQDLNQVIIQLNQLIAKSVIEDQEIDKSSRLTLVDIDQIIAKLISIPSSKSFKWEPSNYCIDDFNLEKTEICKCPQNLFFWDKEHPNTISHERITNELETKFKRLRLI